METIKIFYIGYKFAYVLLLMKQNDFRFCVIETWRPSRAIWNLLGSCDIYENWFGETLYFTLIIIRALASLPIFDVTSSFMT